ncbi:MAG: hypothetical protein HYT20_01045 [Candidatus Nealsonbacteria bacterium]|nr:hypothetical protein [Candidatus Nealsonbacteria bacterium]
MENTQNTCKCAHHKVMPMLIVLLGLTFLFKELGTLSVGAANVIWPSIVIVMGLKKMMGHCKCC